MILVTGATGFVGTNLCTRLEREGVAYRALARDLDKARARGLPPGRVVRGDLDGDLAVALEGVDRVVHVAGLVRARRASDLERVNGAATARLAAAVAAGAPGARFVLVSSLAAAGPSADGAGSACGVATARPVSDYGRSKLSGERAVVESRLPWLVLRPGIVYGPWDSDVLLLFRAAQRGLGILSGPPARYSLVHVDDLVTAIILAVSVPATGTILPIGHPEPIGDADWLRALGSAVGRRPRVLRLPLAMGWLAAHAAETAAFCTRRAAVFGADKYREMRAGSWVVDPEPARRVLGFEAAIGHEVGLRQTAAWYRERGWLGA